jgi:hypothetical protein
MPKKRKHAVAKPSAKTTAKPRRASGTPTGALIPQPHGGAIRNGGTNRGGPGRTPEVLRMKSRELYERWIAWAAKKMKAQNAADDLMMQIGNTSGKYGFAPSDMVSRQDVRERLQKQIDIIISTLSSADAERLIAALHPVWFPG